MKITLSCVGGCAQYVPGGGKKTGFDATSGESVLALLERLGVHKDLFMFTLINGERADLTRTLSEGDDVVLVSAISGG